MADEPGIVGGLNGPNSGSTPDKDNDLHSNGQNPWAAVGPHYTQQPLAYPPTAPFGYYDNPPIRSTDNPWSAGDRTGVENLTTDAAASQALGNGQSGDAPASSANASAIWNDEGMGPDGNGNSV